MKMIPDFPDYYAGDDGRIYSSKTAKLKQLTEFRYPNNDYLMAYLYKNESKSGFYVHNLVALAYFRRSTDTYRVLHKDGNTFNNRPENLSFEKLSESEKLQKAYLTDAKTGNDLANINQELALRLWARVGCSIHNKVWVRYSELKERSNPRALYNWLKIYTDMDFLPDSLKSVLQNKGITKNKIELNSKPVRKNKFQEPERSWEFKKKNGKVYSNEISIKMKGFVYKIKK